MTSCGESPLETEWERYPQRIAKLVQAKEKPINNVPLPPVDQAFNQYRTNIADFKLPLFQALSITDCHLQTYIGERNSSLGKVQSDSARLIYEVKLLNNLQNCEQLDQSEHSKLLRSILQNKQQNWPSHVNNYLIQASEIKNILRLKPQLIEFDTNGYYASLNFLKQLKKIITWPTQNTTQAANEESHPQAQQLSAVMTQFEHSVAELNNRDFLAQFFYSLDYTSRQLEQVSALLNFQINKNACTTNYKPIEIEYLQNVFYRFYAKILQPHLAKLNKMQTELAPIIAQIWQHSKIQHSPFGVRYLTQGEQSVYIEFENNIKKHTQAWQTLLKQCQLMPK